VTPPTTPTTPPSDHVDILIIGAGVAGTAAALSAARAAARSTANRPANCRPPRILLVDRAPWPRDKVCGCCLTAHGVAALAALGIPPLSASPHAVPLHQVRICSGRSAVTLGLRPGGTVISRLELDALMVRTAQAAGVTFIPQCSAAVLPRSATASPSAPWLVTLSTPNSQHTIAASCIIAADGLAGRSLAALPELAVRTARTSPMGAGAIAHWGPLTATLASTSPAEPDALPPGRVILATGSAGYIGLVRLACGRVDIAAALNPAAARRAGGPGPLMQQLMARAGLVPTSLAASPAPWPARISGTPLLTRSRTGLALPGLLITGDSAGYVQPFTGEGMTWAIRGGSHAGHLAATCTPDEAAARWSRWHATHIVARQRVCRAVAAIVGIPALAHAAIWAAGTLPPARALAQRVALGLGHDAHAPLAAPDNADSANSPLARHPQHAWSIS